jgi:multidrug transporter EmrE-like cation transporter
MAIIGGTSTVCVLLVGVLALQEPQPLTWVRLLAIVLIASGTFLLQTQGG